MGNEIDEQYKSDRDNDEERNGIYTRTGRVRRRKWFLHTPPYVTRSNLHNGACRRLLYLNNGSCAKQRFEIRFRVRREDMQIALRRAYSVTFSAISLPTKFARIREVTARAYFVRIVESGNFLSFESIFVREKATGRGDSTNAWTCRQLWILCLVLVFK